MWEAVWGLLVSLGGGGAIVLGLSGYIGRIWATRLMDRERQTHARELEAFRADLSRKAERELSEARTLLELSRQVHYHEYSEKLTIYRAVTDIVADMVIELQVHGLTGAVSPEVHLQIERLRLRVYGYMGMLAPGAVMTKLDALMDYLLDAADGTTTFDFAHMRTLAYDMLNEIRQDIAINKDRVAYTGRR